MPEAPSSSEGLHLPDLSITGFRGIKALTISRLGRVTLIAGKNGVGKTTILDAIRLYAARGEYDVLTDILQKREELTDTEEEDGHKATGPNWEALFYGRDISQTPLATIGATRSFARLTIKIVISDEDDIANIEKLYPRYLTSDEPQFIMIAFHHTKGYIPISHYSRDDVRGLARSRSSSSIRWLGQKGLDGLRCETIGPGLPSNDSLASTWDEIILTPEQPRMIEALNLISEASVTGIAMVGIGRNGRYGYSRRAVIQIEGESERVPLRTLGDGATRLLGVALAFANCQNGFLLIDEAENGIHHSIQRDFWTMVMRAAHANNVQVLATTHGWDCVRGFAQAAEDVNEVEAALVRLEKDGDAVRAVEYSERNLKAAARSGIEVR